MGSLVIACYKPFPDKENEFMALVREHVPALRALGLATERKPIVMRASCGTVLEIFEWVSSEAAQKAHHMPEIAKLWERFGAVCEFKKPSDVGDLSRMFPHFDPIDFG